MNYAIRITRSYDVLRKAVENIAFRCEKMLVYEHEGSRIHCHFLLVGCEVSTDTLKNYIKKELGVVDKNDWSFKKADTEFNKYITYMSKGKLQEKFDKGFGCKILEELKSAWEEKAVDSSAARQPSPKKVNYWDIILSVRSQLEFVDHLGVFGWQHEPKQSNGEIYDLLIKELEKHKIRAADYELKRWLHTIVREYDKNLRSNVIKSLDKV